MRQRLGLFVICSLFLWPALASGAGISIAVMPVEDLSQGANGYSAAMTADIAAILRERGVKVIPDAEVMQFMVTHRVRRLGYLDSQQLAKLKEQFGVDIVVLASVNQRREEEPPALGLTLQMVRTADGRVIWAGGGELCRADVRRLLGLAEPKTIDDVEKMVVRQVMANLPESFESGALGGPVRLVDSARLTASILRPGESVACRIHFSGQEGRKYEDVVVLVGNKEVPLTFREREHYYEAVWPAEAGAGEVTVSLKVGEGKSDRQEIFVGTYHVDSQPPKVVLQAVGPQLDGHVILKESLSMVPVLVEPEPISRWHLEVVDQEGRIIMSGDGDGLPDRFMWQGQNNQGGMAADGLYKVILSVWDRAGNTAATSLDVEVLRRPPPVEITFQRLSDGVAVDLGYSDRVPLARWRAQFFTATGDLLQEEGGEKLPSRMHLPQELIAGTKVRLVLHAQDILGNVLKKVLVDIGGQAAKAEAASATEEPVPAAGWVEDF
ncbi:MAG: hypothetical protein ACOY8P_08705 [Thermodesulfobacteriota bacterium]